MIKFFTDRFIIHAKQIIRRSLPAYLQDLLKLTFLGKRYQVVQGPLTYNQDGLATLHNSDFIRDPRFSRAYALGKATGSWGGDPLWRVQVCCWAASVARNLEGDFVECGVNRGGYSRAVIDYVGFDGLGKKFWLLDTFEGLLPDRITEEERKSGIAEYDYAECYDEVVRTFGGFRNVIIIRGPVPETLVQAEADKVSYLSIDMNCVEPEIAAAEYFWDKLVTGAVVILDDYGWKRHINQKLAFDAFAKRKNVTILSLPTGQGLIVKP